MAPSDDLPACLSASRATISACLPGGGSVAPSKTSPSLSTNIAPTQGFGDVVPTILDASANALPIIVSSKEATGPEGITIPTMLTDRTHTGTQPFPSSVLRILEYSSDPKLLKLLEQIDTKDY